MSRGVLSELVCMIILASKLVLSVALALQVLAKLSQLVLDGKPEVRDIYATCLKAGSHPCAYRVQTSGPIWGSIGDL